MAEEKMVTITEKEYNQLLEDSEWLSYLNAAGVDNWEGYSNAAEMQRDANGETVTLDKL